MPNALSYKYNTYASAPQIRLQDELTFDAPNLYDNIPGDLSTGYSYTDISNTGGGSINAIVDLGAIYQIKQLGYAGRIICTTTANTEHYIPIVKIAYQASSNLLAGDNFITCVNINSNPVKAGGEWTIAVAKEELFNQVAFETRYLQITLGIDTVEDNAVRDLKIELTDLRVYDSTGTLIGNPPAVNFSITTPNPVIKIPIGNNGIFSSNILIKSHNGFNSPLTLSTDINNGFNIVFSPNPVTPVINSNTTVNFTATLLNINSIPPGIYPFNIIATDVSTNLSYKTTLYAEVLNTISAVSGNEYAEITINNIFSTTPYKYALYQGTSSGGENAIPIVSGIQPANGIAQKLEITGLMNGVTYYFYAIATDPNTGYAIHSNEISVIPNILSTVIPYNIWTININGSLVISSPSTDTVLYTLSNFNTGGMTYVSTTAYNILFSTDLSKAYVAWIGQINLGPKDYYITDFDTTTIPPTRLSDNLIANHTSNDRMFWDSNTVIRIYNANTVSNTNNLVTYTYNINTHTFTTPTVISPPFTLNSYDDNSYANDGKYMSDMGYVNSGSNSTKSIYDLTNSVHKYTLTIPGTGGFANILHTNNKIYVNINNNISILGLVNLNTLNVVPLSQVPKSTYANITNYKAISTDGRYVYFGYGSSTLTNNAIAKLDTTTDTIINNFNLSTNYYIKNLYSAPNINDKYFLAVYYDGAGFYRPMFIDVVNNTYKLLSNSQINGDNPHLQLIPTSNVQNYIITLSPNIHEVAPGNSIIVTATITYLNTFNARVDLSYIFPYQNTTVTPSKNFVTSSDTVTYTIDFSNSAISGDYMLGVIGNSETSPVEKEVASQIIWVKNSYNVLLGPNVTIDVPNRIFRLGNIDYVVIRIYSNDYTGLAHFTCIASSGLNITRSPLTITLTSGQYTNLYVYTSSSNAGVYTLTANLIINSFAQSYNITDSGNIQYIQGDYNITASPLWHVAPPNGETVSYTITANSLDSFNNTITLRNAIIIPHANFGISYDSNTLLAPINNSISTNLNLVVNNDVAEGDYKIVVSGDYLTEEESISLSLTVANTIGDSDFTLRILPQVIYFVNNIYNYNVNILLGSVNGFSSPVTLSVANSNISLLNINFSINPITPLPNQNNISVLSFTLPSNIASGEYVITVQGVYNSKTHSDTFIVIVNNNVNPQILLGGDNNIVVLDTLNIALQDNANTWEIYDKNGNFIASNNNALGWVGTHLVSDAANDTTTPLFLVQAPNTVLSDINYYIIYNTNGLGVTATGYFDVVTKLPNLYITSPPVSASSTYLYDAGMSYTTGEYKIFKSGTLVSTPNGNVLYDDLNDILQFLDISDSLTNHSDYSLWYSFDGSTNQCMNFSVTPITTIAPITLIAIGAWKAIVLNWTPYNQVGVTYNIYMGLSPNGEDVTPIQTGITGLSAVINNLRVGITYYFVVEAIVSSIVKSTSNEASALPGQWNLINKSAAFLATSNFFRAPLLVDKLINDEITGYDGT